MKPQNKPLITELFTADPSAHVYEDKIYIYPSHDIPHNGSFGWPGPANNESESPTDDVDGESL